MIFGLRQPAAGSKVYHIKIALKNFTPEIWRDVLVPADFSFLEFSWTIMLAMGWRHNRNWVFLVPGFEIRKNFFGPIYTYATCFCGFYGIGFDCECAETDENRW